MQQTATSNELAFVEAVVAPAYDAAALDVLTTKKNVRVLSTDPHERGDDWARFEIKRVEVCRTPRQQHHDDALGRVALATAGFRPQDVR